MPLPPLFEGNFPTYIVDHSVKDVQVYWYHPDFTQSRYPPGQEISEACTLICLLVAQRICQLNLQISSVEKTPKLGILIAESIVEGNRTHARILERDLVPHPYLSVDEALRFGGKRMKTLKEWKFHVFKENIALNLRENIEEFLRKWRLKPKAAILIMLLITCGRTILFIFQEKTGKVTLFDSHSHTNVRDGPRGLVIAQVKWDKLSLLCDWYINSVLYDCFNARADQYELAFLYHRPSGCCSSSNRKTSCECSCSNNC